MQQLIELLQQIQDLAGVAIEALQKAGGAAAGAEAAGGGGGGGGGEAPVAPEEAGPPAP